MGFLIRVDCVGVLQRLADVVEALEQNFFAWGSNLELEDQPVLVVDSLIRKIKRNGIAIFLLGSLE